MMEAGAQTEDAVGAQADHRALALAARRALAADAVVITFEPAAGARLARRPAPVVAGCPDGSGRELLCRDVARLGDELRFHGDEPLVLSLISAREGVTARLAATHGFAAGLATPVRREGARVGTIVALRHEPGPFTNAGMITAFSRQLAVSIGAAEVPARPASAAVPRLESLVLAGAGHEELSAAISEHVAPLFGAGTAGVMVWEPQAGMLRLLPGGFGVSPGLRRRTQVRASDLRSNASRVFSTGCPYICNEALDDPGVLPDHTRALGIERVITLPLSIDGRRIGVIHFANGPEDFGIGDLARAASVLPGVAAAVELARTLHDLRREGRIEATLSAVAAAVAAGECGADMVESTLRQMGEALEVQGMAFLPDGDEPLIWGDVPPSLAGAAAGLRDRAALFECGDEEGRGHTFCIPVRSGERSYGTLVAWRGWPQPFEVDECRALVRLATIAAAGSAAEAVQREQAERVRMRERQRIADDLHDDVAQVLFAAQFNLEAIRDRADEGTALEIERALGLLIRGDRAMREMIDEISRPPRESFEARLAAVAATVEQQFSQPVDIELGEDACALADRLGGPAAEALLRAAREGLVNSAKHARASRAVVAVASDERGRLRLTVQDDGIGYPEGARAGHGLAALRRRVAECGGELRIQAAPHRGTELEVTLDAAALSSERPPVAVGGAAHA